MEALLAITIGLERILLELVAIACKTLLWSLSPIVTLISYIEPRRHLLAPSVASSAGRGAPVIVMVSLGGERRLGENCPSGMALFVPLAGGGSRRQEGRGTLTGWLDGLSCVLSGDG